MTSRKVNHSTVKSPDIRFLAWSIFALALSLPLTAWVWSHGERPSAPAIVLPATPAPLAPAAPLLVQSEPAPTPAFEGVPVGFMGAVVEPQKEGALVRYTINRDAWVTLLVVSPQGEVVAPLGSLRAESGREYKTFWDGRDRSGRLAPLRKYLIQIAAQAGDRTAVVKKPVVLPTIP